MIITMILSLLFIDLSLSDQNLTRNIGQDVVFTCILENVTEINQVSFMHQNTGDILSVGLELLIDQSTSNHHRMQLTSFSTNRLDFKMSSLTQNDSGLYTCMFNDDKLSSYLLEVYAPPEFDSYYPLEASISYPEGSTMNFSCHVTAFPPVTIQWTFQNKNKETKVIHSGENIELSSIEPTDSGLYVCTASNDYHESISRSFYVTIQYRPRVTISKSIDVSVQQTEILCKICALPKSHFRWFKNEKQIINNKRFSIEERPALSDNDECFITVLQIQKQAVSIEISDRYECRAENYLGRYSDHIDFYSKSTKQLRPRTESPALLFHEKIANMISNSSTSNFKIIGRYFIFIFILNKFHHL